MMTDKDELQATKKKKLFYTTSDMMKTINKSIASLDSPDDAISPRVELQRRMPDGSTRRADEKDLKAADMDSMLKQVSTNVLFAFGMRRRKHSYVVAQLCFSQ